MRDRISVTRLSCLPSHEHLVDKLQALAAYVTQCVGIDLSEGMVEVYNTSAQNQGIPESEMHAVVGNLIDAKSPPPAHLAGPEFHDFDIAVVGLGFHHFDDPALAAKRLAERLKPGGVLMIVDFLPHEHFGGQSHGHSMSFSLAVSFLAF